jgi:type IV pilus biogenesis protein CpaD/CtpE
MRNTNTNLWVKPAMAAAVALLATACASNPPSAQDDPLADRRSDLASVDTTRDTGIRDAILTEHTIYPYHFETGTALLNSLGERDLAVLADNYRQNGSGVISLRRGDASDELYAARTLAIKSALTHLGVTADNVKIDDAPASGETATGNDVNAILKADAARRDASGSSSGGASGVSGGGTASPGGAAAAATGGM